MNIAIFASGNGSNFQALVDDKLIKPHVKLLVCDKPNAYVLERANKAHIPVFLLKRKIIWIRKLLKRKFCWNYED